MIYMFLYQCQVIVSDNADDDHHDDNGGLSDNDAPTKPSLHR